MKDFLILAISKLGLGEMSASQWHPDQTNGSTSHTDPHFCFQITQVLTPKVTQEASHTAVCLSKQFEWSTFNSSKCKVMRAAMLGLPPMQYRKQKYNATVLRTWLCVVTCSTSRHLPSLWSYVFVFSFSLLILVGSKTACAFKIQQWNQPSTMCWSKPIKQKAPAVFDCTKLPFIQQIIPSFILSFCILHSFNPSPLDSFLPRSVPPFLPSCLASFLPSFLPFFMIHPLIPSCLPSFLLAFLPSFLLSFLPSFLSSFLLLFLSSVFCSFRPSFVSSFLLLFFPSFFPSFFSSFSSCSFLPSCLLACLPSFPLFLLSSWSCPFLNSVSPYSLRVFMLKVLPYWSPCVLTRVNKEVPNPNPREDTTAITTNTIYLLYLLYVLSTSYKVGSVPYSKIQRDSVLWRWSTVLSQRSNSIFHQPIRSAFPPIHIGLNKIDPDPANANHTA